MENRERICRFCFEKCDTNYKAIEKSTHEILNVLQVTVNLAISDEPVMCTNCSDTLQKFFDFKKTCINVRDHTVAFGSDENNGHVFCQFCMNLLKDCPFTILDIEGNISEKTTFEKYLPELDLGASKKPICEVCRGSVVNFFSFITISSTVEENIRKYCKTEGINDKDPIKLNNVLRFTSENVRKKNDNGPDVIKMEDVISVKSENETINIQGGICALCSEKCENLKAIDGNIKNGLDILLPKTDFSIIQGPVMCNNCEEVLLKCFEFKTVCLQTQNYIVSFLNNKDDALVDLKDVYASKNATGIFIPEDQNVCRFCMGLVKNCSAVALDVEMGDVMLEVMIEECVPELDLRIIKKPVICASCHESLKDCFHFVTNCLTLGERIKKYCETPGTNNSLQFTRDVTTREVDGNWVNAIKVEQFCESVRNSNEREIGNGGGTVKFEQIFFEDSGYVIEGIENKNKSFVEMNDREVYNEQKFSPKNMLACAEESDKPGTVKIEEIFCGENETAHKGVHLGLEDQQFLPNGEIEIKTEQYDFNRFEDNIFLPQSEVISRLCRRKKRLAQDLERDQSSPYVKQTLPKKRVLKTRIYQCDLCSFQTKYKQSLVNHNLLHEDFRKHLPAHKDPSEVNIYNCDSCSFQTKHKVTFMRHLMKHKDPSEATMFKSDLCLYQTKRKSNLKKHNKYKDPKEVKMYKCDSCLYQSKRKHDLSKHLLKHKDPSEVTMYKCESCVYQTKREHDLKKHLVLHKDPSEIIMYKCVSCSFQTKHKNHLQKHSLKHKDPSQVTIYKCDFCSYQTKYKYCLNKHLLKHKDPSEVTMYKCETCPFETKYKFDLKNHLLKHKGPLEVTMYKCDFCLYQTKRKNDLKTHLLNHKDPSEVTMHKCDTCSFQTKHKASLRSHSLKHKNLSEVTVYKCESCPFQTKAKPYLKRHLIIHKSPQEITMYKCDYCSFQTKHKSSLERHLLTHNEASEVPMSVFILERT